MYIPRQCLLHLMGTIALTVLLTSSTQAALLDGLQLYSPMDDVTVNRSGVNPPPALETNSGSYTVQDLAGTVQNGTALPTTNSESATPSGQVVSSATGIVGEALSFTAEGTGYTVTGERRVDYGNVLNDAGNGYTVSLWFKPATTSGTQFIASKGNGGSASNGWSIWQSSTGIVVRGSHNGTGDDSRVGAYRSNSITTADTWYHVALVIDPDAVVDGDAKTNDGRWIAYFNGLGSGTTGQAAVNQDLANGWKSGGGAAVTNTFATGDIFDSTTSIRLGARDSLGAEFNGLIDEFAIWDRALSADEINDIYQAGLNGDPLAPVPEPSTVVLLAIGVFAGLLVWRRKRT